MRRSARAPVSPIVITVGASLLVVLAVAWGAGPWPPSARAAAVVSAVAPKRVPLESVPFGPPGGTHHVTGTGVEDGPLGLYAFVPAEGVVASGHPVDIRLEVHNGGN